MKTLSYFYGKEQDITVGSELYFGQIWDGEEGDTKQLLEDGSVCIDGECIIEFEVIEEDKDDPLDTFVRITGII